MNELERVLSIENNDELSTYLGEVTCADFRNHINELISKHTDKGAIRLAIKKLQEIIK